MKLRVNAPIILIAIIFCFSKASAQTDYEKIITNVTVEIKKGYTASSTAINAATTTLMNNLNPDGTWSDLTYSAGAAGDVPFNTHLSRIKQMSIAYTFTGGSHFGSSTLYNKLVSALQYWNNNIHDADNWYQDQIGYPQLLGEMLIIMRGSGVTGTTQLSSTDENAVINYLSTRLHPSSNTGANRVDESVHWIYRGALTTNASVVNTGVTEALSTLAIVNSGSQGLNSDYAFLQHNSQLMIQGYGRDFLDGIYGIAVYVFGTSFSYTSAQLQNAYTFLHHSYVGAARGRYKDFSLDGRGISRVNSNRGITANIIAKAMAVDPVHVTQLQPDSLRVTEQQPSSYMVTQPYHIHFWTGDYTLHNRPAYSFAVRSVSTRTVRTETMNGENLLGKWLSDGATSIRVNGNEYYNIFPVWDWNKIPGITMREFATQQTNTNGVNSYGNTAFVGGVSDSSYGASIYTQNNGGVTATKSWFFFDNEIVCLGAGISSSQPENVATTINQSLLDGPVSIKSGGVITTMPAATQQNYPGNLSWVLHDSVGYFFPSAGNATISNQTQSGNWSNIGTSLGAVSTDVFKLWLNHGVTPANATYSYIVAPNILTTSQMDAYNTAAIQVLSNTSAKQAVLHSGLNIVQVIFSSAGTLTIPGTELSSVTVDKPCALILKNINTNNPTISIADPSQQNGAVNMALTFVSSASKNIFCTLPTGNYKGSSKVFTANSAASSYTPGTLAILRIGGVNGTNGLTGSTTPGTNGVPVHIDKYSVTGPGVITYESTIDLPATATNKIFNSSSLNEGYLTQSDNKQWISLMGYANTGTGNVYNTTNNPNTARVLGLVRHNGNVNLTTALSNFPVSGTAATTQSAITSNGTDLWCVTNQGNAMGVLYTTLGATNAAGAPSVNVSSTAVSNKSLSIFGGDLFYASNSGARIGKVSTSGGLPTTTGNTMTGLTVAAGSTAFSSFSPSQIVMFDLAPSVLGYDVMYVTNSSTTTTLAGIYKYCKNAAGEWVSYGTFGSIASDGSYFGITGEVIDGLPVLYVTRGITTTTTVNTNQLIQLKESNAYNANMDALISATTDATVSTKNGTIRGVAFYPTAAYNYNGTGNLNELSSWGINQDGTGTAPANFTSPGQIFMISNATTATLSGNLTVSGENSKIIVGNGINATTLTIPSNFSINSEMDIYNNVVLNIQNDQTPSLHFLASNSTVNYASPAPQVIMPMAYGNLTNSNTNTSTIDGTVTVTGNFTQNGLLNGHGTLVVPNGLLNNGTIAPGNSPGQLSVTGNFTNAVSGILQIELGGNTAPGNDYDQLAVSGSSSLSGILDISLVNGFTPQAGQTFTILTSSSVSGIFNTVNWPIGVVGTVIYNPTSVVLSITSVILPLHLLSFSGNLLENNEVRLQWNTANEDNVDYFQIEYSNNGREFKQVAAKKAIGFGDNNYSKTLFNNESTIQYYRLKVVDKDGKFYYSQIIVIKNNAVNDDKLIVFPNPATNTITVTHEKTGKNASIKLIDINGKIILINTVTPGAMQTGFNISQVVPGIYILIFENNGTVMSQKLLKM